MPAISHCPEKNMSARTSIKVGKRHAVFQEGETSPVEKPSIHDRFRTANPLGNQLNEPFTSVPVDNRTIWHFLSLSKRDIE